MYIALTLHLLWTLGAAAVITRRQRIPASAAAWLALVFLLPVAGTPLYVLAGYRRAVPAAESCDCRGRRRGADRRPRPRNPPAPRNSVSLFAQRQQRLHGADRRPATRRPLDPHGVLHHPRRPHRAHHRRNPDPQSPRRTRSARHLRRRRLVAAEPHDIAPHARRRGTHGRLRAGALPVVHHARLAPQPPQNSRHGRPCRLSGWHKYCEILPRRRLHGQVARRAPPHRGRRREGLATALHRRLGAGHGRMSRPAPLRRPHGIRRACRSSWPGPKRAPRG